MTDEVGLRSEEVRHDEVEDQPELVEPVLYRGAGEYEYVVRAEASGRFGRSGLGFLEEVPLVEDAVSPADLI